MTEQQKLSGELLMHLMTNGFVFKENAEGDWTWHFWDIKAAGPFETEYSAQLSAIAYFLELSLALPEKVTQALDRYAAGDKAGASQLLRADPRIGRMLDANPENSRDALE